MTGAQQRIDQTGDTRRDQAVHPPFTKEVSPHQ
jgi:hypothetical protein